MTEGEWRRPQAVWVELVGIVEDGRVTAGGGKYNKGAFPGLDGDITEDVVVCGRPHHGLRGAVEAE